MTTKPVVRRKAGSSRVSDGLMNVIQGAGTSRDRQQYARYNPGYVDPTEVESAYVTSGLCRKIHDIPPFEMTREGRDWQAQDTDISALENLEQQLQVWSKIREALITARLTGGAVIVMGLPGNSATAAPQGGRGALRYLSVLSRNQVQLGEIQRDLNKPGFGEPIYYELQTDGATQRIHPSRVIPFVSQRRPAGAMFGGSNEFWGDPLLLSIEMALKNNDSAYQNLAALLGESKVDTVTIPGLSDRLATTEYESALTKRLAVAQMFQSQFNMRLIEGGATDNAPSEKWETRQISFAGLPEVVRTFGVFLAGVVDIPYSRLFGESPGGLNSTGKNEQVDFERMIRSKQNVELRPALDRLDPYLITSALGSTPKDIYWTFSPLSVMDEEQASKVEKSDAETLKIYVDAGVIPNEVASEAVKNRLIEGGRFPGIERAYADYADGLLVPDLDEGEPEPELPVDPA